MTATMECWCRKHCRRRTTTVTEAPERIRTGARPSPQQSLASLLDQPSCLTLHREGSAARGIGASSCRPLMLCVKATGNAMAAKFHNGSTAAVRTRLLRSQIPVCNTPDTGHPGDRLRHWLLSATNRLFVHQTAPHDATSRLVRSRCAGSCHSSLERPYSVQPPISFEVEALN